jgi:hypothetical protein
MVGCPWPSRHTQIFMKVLETPQMVQQQLDACAVRCRAEDFLFGKPLVVNVYRSVLVEAMLDIALGDDWKWVAGDYAPFDFRHSDQTRLEVKQASYHQSWTSTAKQKPTFDVAKRTGFFEGELWTEHAQPARNTDLYVFGHHGVEDRSLADHRRPDQWHFAVIDATLLGAEKTLSRKRLTEMSGWCAIDQVLEEVEKLRCGRSK